MVPKCKVLVGRGVVVGPVETPSGGMTVRAASYVMGRSRKAPPNNGPTNSSIMGVTRVETTM